MIGGLPAWPFASAITQSFVLMSSSIVSRSNVSRAAPAIAAFSSSGEIAQSVVSTVIIVASCGAIIPEPFAIADSVTVRPPSSSTRLASLRHVSVVMIASAAVSGSGPSAPTSLGTAATSLATGNLTPMMPVDADTIALAGMPSACATAACTAVTASSPRGPVSAFALPLLSTTACMPDAGSRASASITGAALALLIVNMPAALHGVAL